MVPTAEESGLPGSQSTNDGGAPRDRRVSAKTADLDAPTFIHLDEAGGKDGRKREGKKAKP